MVETTSYLEIATKILPVLFLLTVCIFFAAILVSAIFMMRDRKKYPMPDLTRIPDWIHAQADRFFLWFMDTITRTKHTDELIWGDAILDMKRGTMRITLDAYNGLQVNDELKITKMWETEDGSKMLAVSRNRRPDPGCGPPDKEKPKHPMDVELFHIHDPDDHYQRYFDEDDEATCIFVDGKLPLNYPAPGKNFPCVQPTFRPADSEDGGDQQ